MKLYIINYIGISIAIIFYPTQALNYYISTYEQYFGLFFIWILFVFVQSYIVSNFYKIDITT